MTLTEISNIRLSSQKIARDHLESPGRAVSWLVALQAQDLQMAMLAIGLRLPKSKYESVEAAMNDGSIVRTHLLRPTYQIAAAEDVRWLLELTAPHIRAAMRSRHLQLELSKQVVSKSNKIFEKALKDGNQSTRGELLAKLKDAKIVLNENRASHLLLCAELDGIICSGAMRRGKPTYAFFEDRIPAAKRMDREEGLAELARRYFTGRCPATLEDFIWWSGLPVKDAKRALEIMKGSFDFIPIQSKEYIFPQSYANTDGKRESVHLLPAFDEILISYKDRSASFSLVQEKKVVSNNGIFRPIVAHNGQIIGIWKRTLEKKKMNVEVSPLKPCGKSLKTAIEKAATKIGGFYGMETGVFYISI